MISKVSKVFDYSAIASGIVLFLLAVLTFCDVFGRRFLNSPVTGTIELVEIGMALVAFLAMPRAFYLNANVSADFINNLNLGILKTYLYKLNQKKYYKKMKYGYARGWEAVQYIENVKQYYDIITFLDNKDKKSENGLFNEVPSTL